MKTGKRFDDEGMEKVAEVRCGRPAVRPHLWERSGRQVPPVDGEARVEWCCRRCGARRTEEVGIVPPDNGDSGCVAFGRRGRRGAVIRAMLAIVVLFFAACTGEGLAVPSAPDAASELVPAIDAGGIPTCGSGPIVIAEDCGTLPSGWRCEVPTDPARPPCLVTNLDRVLVASCDLCQGVQL